MIYSDKIPIVSQDLFYDTLKTLRLTPLSGEAIFVAEGIEMPLLGASKHYVDQYIEECCSQGIIPFAIQRVQYDKSGLITANRRVAFRKDEQKVLELMVIGGRDAEVYIDLSNGFDYFKGIHTALLQQAGYELDRANIVLSKYSSADGKYTYNNVEVTLSKHRIQGVELKIRNPDHKDQIQRDVKKWFAKLRSRHKP